MSKISDIVNKHFEEIIQVIEENEIDYDIQLAKETIIEELEDNVKEFIKDTTDNLEAITKELDYVMWDIKALL